MECARLRLLGLIVSAVVTAAPPQRSVEIRPPVPLAGAPGELLDLRTSQSLPLEAMRETRTDFQTSLLPDGKVLISGGSLRGGSTEVLDPNTGRFGPGPSLVHPRSGHRAQVLKDGRILLVGGTERPSPAEVLDVGATAFRPLTGPTFGLSAEAVPLPEGVLLIDGATRQCWIWNGTDAPQPTGSLQRARLFFRATALADGRVLVTGGWPQEALSERTARPAPTAPRFDLPIECYHPRKQRWSLWKGTLPARAGHQALLLKDGRVLLIGGFGAKPNHPLDTAQIVDPNREVLLDPLPMPNLGLSPGAATLSEELILLPERTPHLVRLTSPERPNEASKRLSLANAFLAPQLLPLPSERLLVLGSPVWGPALERWDPRTGQFTYIGALRSGTERLVLVGSQVWAVGPIVDRVDVRTGNLTPLGRQETLASTLARARSTPPAPNVELPPFPDGQPRTDTLVVSLDRRRLLVLGGTTPAQPEGTDTVFLLDQPSRRWLPTGSLRAPRAFPRGRGGALRLPDGSVLVWGP